MSDLIAAFLVVIGFEEPETLPRSLHPLKPDSAWSSGGVGFRHRVTTVERAAKRRARPSSPRDRAG